MKAALLERYDSDVALTDVSDPACPPDGALVEVQACGICRSDHHAWKGSDPDVALPHVMGHEFAGVVIETGPDCHRFKPGDRVTAPFILACGRCRDCASGRPTACDRQEVIGFTFWGAFAETVAIPRGDMNLVSLPDSLDAVSAAGMGCRVTTAWRALTDRADLKPGEWLVIHGAGGIGLSATMIGAALGARVLAVDISDGALALARKMGATATLNVSGLDDPGDAIRDLTSGGGDVSVDGLGTSTTFENSLRSLRKLGRHVQIGMPVGQHEVVPLPLLDLVYARQLTLHGTRGLGAAGFRPLLDMIDGGRLDPSRLVTRTVPLSQAGVVLREMDGAQPPGVTVIDQFTV